LPVGRHRQFGSVSSSSVCLLGLHWLAVIVVSRHCRLLAWLVAAVVIVVTGLSRSSSPLVSGCHRHCAFGIPSSRIVSYSVIIAWWSWPALRLHCRVGLVSLVLGICGHGHVSTGWSLSLPVGRYLRSWLVSGAVPLPSGGFVIGGHIGSSVRSVCIAGARCRFAHSRSVSGSIAVSGIACSFIVSTARYRFGIQAWYSWSVSATGSYSPYQWSVCTLVGIQVVGHLRSVSVRSAPYRIASVPYRWLARVSGHCQYWLGVIIAIVVCVFSARQVMVVIRTSLYGLSLPVVGFVVIVITVVC
jgi:hypothetical protein